MGTIWVKEQVGGLDARRLRETTAGGQLIKGQDGHITRGGEFEKRAAFVRIHTLPEGTVGLASNKTSLVVFGKGATPSGMPATVGYQRLDTGAEDLVYIPSWDLYDNRVYAVAEYADGSIAHFFDEDLVTDWFDGRARFSFDVTGGSGTVDTITVGGIEVLGAAVAWDTDTDGTAADVAAQINTYTSSPNYTAVATGNRVTILAPVSGVTANGLAVVVTTTSISVSPATGAMGGGAASDSAFQPGTVVRTLIRKMFALSGSLTHFSGLDAPEQFNTDAVGAGFVDMSREASLESDLTGLATYNQYVAIFSSRAILIYFFDPDPALTRKSQVLLNTGTEFPRTVTQFGDADVFYLDTTGLRSLRARDSSSAAATSDIGVPVDELIRADIEALDEVDRRKVFGLIEPRDGRFWLVIRNKIYVFSSFPGSRVSAWTTYSPGFEVDDIVVHRGKVYLRSGDDIYVYGGTGATLEYDATEPEMWLPYLDADKPTDEKMWTGIDAAVRGQWEISFGLDLNDENISDKIATISKTTYNQARIYAEGRSTHISVRLKGKGSDYAKAGAVIIHYEDTDPDTEDSNS